MMCVDIDDEKVLIVARAGLLRSMLKMLCGRVVVEVKLADFVGNGIHAVSSTSGHDVDVVASPHDIEFLQLELAVAHAFARS